MGGCCGAMKTGQKSSLPDKKKSDANQEKSNGKESIPQAVPATETAETPEQKTEQDERLQDVSHQKQEPIVAPAEVSVNATEPVKGILVTGPENVMDIETAVAPFEGVISNDQPQPDSQSNAVSTDSEILLPYQIPVQHTISNAATTTITTTTTKTTTTTFKHEELRIDEPQPDAALQDGDVQLSITERVLDSSVDESELLSSSSTEVEVETVRKATEPAAEKAVPAIPELIVVGDVEGGFGVSEETSEEPVAVVENSFSHEVQRSPEEILPSKESEVSNSIPEVTVDAETPLPAATTEIDTDALLEPVLATCPPDVPAPEPPLDPHFIAVCPPASSFEFTETEWQGKLVAPIELNIDRNLIEEPESLIQKREEEEYSPTTELDLQQQAVADLEKALESEKELSAPEPTPAQEFQINASLEEPEATKQPDEPVADESVAASASFELQSASELQDEQESEISVTTEDISSIQALEDLPPVVPQEHTEDPSVAVPATDVEFEPETLPTDGHTDFQQEPVHAENAEENLPSFEVPADLTPLISEDNLKEKDVVVVDEIAESVKLEQSQTSEPEPYQNGELPSHHQELEQEPQPYQEQQPEEPASYQASSAPESVDQVPASVPETSDAIQSSENLETPSVLELVSAQSRESRDVWWREGDQSAADSSEVPVLEMVLGEAQQSRQAWWDQSGSEPGAESVGVSSSSEVAPPSIPLQQEFAVETTSCQPDDVPSFPPSEEAVTPPIPPESDAVSPSSDTFPEVIPEPLPSTFDHRDIAEIVPDKMSLTTAAAATVESPLSVDGSTIPTENGEVSQSSDEAYTPASVLSPEGSTPESSLSPDGVDQTASSKEPISAQA